MATYYSINSSVEKLMAQARALTNIDILDRDVEASLTILHHSICNDAHLSEQGAVFLEREILRLLCNRLRMLRDFEAHPEIHQQTLHAPVFILGMARTGSTKLQKLLANTGDFNWLPFWQGFNPSLFTGQRGESPQSRIDDADAFLHWYHQIAPDMAYMHRYETHEPEEEHLIHDHSFSAGTFSRYCNCSSWFQWLATQDVKTYLTYARDVLKYLQWQGLQSEIKPWILKTPTNLGLEAKILDVFPDAKFVVAHRHPQETTSSVISLISTWRQPFSEVDVDDIIHTVYEGASMTMQQHLRNRRELNLDCLDVHYSSIKDSAVTVVENIYEFMGMPYGEQVRLSVVDWEQRNPQHSHGQHSHSLEGYGLTKQQVADKYCDYIAFLEREFPAADT